MEFPVEFEFGLDTQLMAIRLAADAERLNVLDDIWTAYLSTEPEPSTVEHDLPEIRGLVDEICDLLERVGKGSVELRGVISELEMSLDDELRESVLQHPLGERLLPFTKALGVPGLLISELLQPEVGIV